MKQHLCFFVEVNTKQLIKQVKTDRQKPEIFTPNTGWICFDGCFYKTLNVVQR